MNQCRECGTNLPDESKYCLQCGTPVLQEAPTSTQPEAELDFVQPALTGGMFLGLLSSLPIIAIGNFFCCMWILGGGGLAAFMLMKQRPNRITYGDAAFAGVLSGLFGAIVSTLISIPLRILLANDFESQRETLEQTFQGVPEFEGPIRDFMLRLASPEISVTTIGAIFFVNLLLYSMFAMIGGILTVALVNKRNQGSGRHA
jgi:hypothetical protein